MLNTTSVLASHAAEAQVEMQPRVTSVQSWHVVMCCGRCKPWMFMYACPGLLRCDACCAGLEVVAVVDHQALAATTS